MELFDLLHKAERAGRGDRLFEVFGACVGEGPRLAPDRRRVLQVVGDGELRRGFQDEMLLAWLGTTPDMTVANRQDMRLGRLRMHARLFDQLAEIAGGT